VPRRGRAPKGACPEGGVPRSGFDLVRGRA
jgi:hypothetical protein